MKIGFTTSLLNFCQLGKLLGVTVTQSPVNDCALSEELCELEDGCTNQLLISDTPLVVNTNATSLVGVMAYNEAICICAARHFDHSLASNKSVHGSSCKANSCFNEGVCRVNEDNVGFQ